MRKGYVALVGSPNVGKSTIFNRLIGTRLAIVDDMPGVTRDRMYGKCSWLEHEFYLIDTGGIEVKDRPFQEEIRIQTEVAMEEADVIVFLADGNLGVTKDDMLVSRLLRKFKKPIILVVNKVDNRSKEANLDDFYSLGLGEPLLVSGVHGIGIGDLLDKIVSYLPKNIETNEDEGKICFTLVGRPNVGKSSLANAIVGEDRLITSNIEGTTRDAIDIDFRRDERTYKIIDTAGLKRRGKIYEAIDKYSALRALKAIERSDIVLLLIDASTGIIEQDKHVIGYAIEQDKAIIIVVNKWDLVEKNTNTMQEFEKKIRREFKFLDYAPIVFVSALKKQRINTIFKAIDVAYDGYVSRIQTSLLNSVIEDAQIMNEAPDFNGGRLRIYYANQVSIKPPTIVLFCNDPNYVHFSYERYLKNKLRETFVFDGSPIKLIFRRKSQ